MVNPADAFEVPIGEDGGLIISAEELARHGIGPGDTVRIQPLRKPRHVSRLGVHRRLRGFAQDDLGELRREMGEGLGENLTG